MAVFIHPDEFAIGSSQTEVGRRKREMTSKKPAFCRQFPYRSISFQIENIDAAIRLLNFRCIKQRLVLDGRQ